MNLPQAIKSADRCDIFPQNGVEEVRLDYEFLKPEFDKHGFVISRPETTVMYRPSDEIVSYDLIFYRWARAVHLPNAGTWLRIGKFSVPADEMPDLSKFKDR